MTEQGKGSAGPGGARSESKQAVDEVRAGLQSAASEGKERARSFLDDQKSVAADRAHGFAGALRDTARKLEDRGDDSSVSHYAERAAEGIDRFADTIREKDVSSVMREAERFARSSPGLFVGGAVVAGILLGRFLRSSRPEPDAPSSGYGSYSGQGSSSAQHGGGSRSSAGQGQDRGAESGTSRFGGSPGSTPSSTRSTTPPRSPGSSPPAGGQR